MYVHNCTIYATVRLPQLYSHEIENYFSASILTFQTREPEELTTETGGRVKRAFSPKVQFND